MQIEKQMIGIVNRNHQCRCVMDRIDNNLRYARFARRLNKISARRKTK